jgi:DNA-binding response OmpR family regulator
MGARILVVDDSPTIRKVVAGILARHDYEPLVAGDGLEALELLRGEGADLVLVDFVMPRMNGYQLCMTIRQQQGLRELPVVLMSAKGDKIRGKFVQQTGALDAITKPFDARGLLAVVESALQKQAGGGGRAADSADEPVSSADDRLSSPSARTSHAALQLSERLAKLLAPSFQRLGVKGPDEADIARAFAHALTPEVAGELAADVAALDLSQGSTEILSGDLGSVAIAEVLQLLDMQKRTGALTLHAKKKRVTLFMRDGGLDFATYAGLPEEFLLGRYLVDSGALSREELDAAIEASRPSGKVLGDYLVATGVLAPEVLTRALARQTSELVYEVVRWRAGRFRFLQKAENELASRARLGLHTSGLVMEGFRRVDEWRLIEDSFDFNDVLFKDEMAIDRMRASEELTREEQRLLDAIDGDATAGEVLDALEGSSFDNCKVLYRLLNSRLVKRRPAASLPAAS